MYQNNEIKEHNLTHANKSSYVQICKANVLSSYKARTEYQVRTMGVAWELFD